jgi:amino acid transporter
MSASLLDLLIGRRVSNREAKDRKIGVLQAIPAMGLDSLSSAAYSPEAALSTLAAGGAAALVTITPITIAIVVLLVMLAFSYWQTVAAYPSSGGSYVVAKENLGTNASLLAAAALMVDYTLNVAVGISAGVAAVTSAIPYLHKFTLPICLAVLAAITLMNLRGTREAGAVWSVPSYLYIASLACIVVLGIIRVQITGGHPPAVVPPAPVPDAVQAVTIWLVLRAFASGCTAMTGIEAVSNSVNAFHEPTTPRARATLAILAVILSCLLLGVAWLAQAYGITAMDQNKPGYQTVLAQLTGAVYGHGWFYYLTLFSILCVLSLSANTSFVGFPRLCHLVASDGFLPYAFAIPGRRLVYSIGILFLAVGAGSLLIAFGGITDRLIPLFAIGAFLSFTLSQAGMAAHWRRALHDKETKSNRQIVRTKLIINGLGAIATGVALAIILVAKFVSGAWLTVIVIPCTLLLLLQIHGYYRRIDQQLCNGADRALDLRMRGEPAVLVPVGAWNQATRKAIEYALGLSHDVTALHVTTLQGEDLDDQAQDLRADWRRFVEEPARNAGIAAPKLRMVNSQFRSVVAPLLREIEAVHRRMPGRQVFVILPQIVEEHWWEVLLQTHRERRLRSRLIRFGGPYIAVIGVPWQLATSDPREGLAEEETADTQR